MNPSGILILLILMLALAATPSTSVALVVMRSATAGFKHGVAVTCGIVLGDLIFVVLAIAGMAALTEAMGSLFIVLRYLAGVYLIWFGISLIRAKSSASVTTQSHQRPSVTASFLSGLVITLGDIKAIFFYASLFPIFVNPAAMGPSEIAIILLITVISVGGVKLAYACATKKALTLTHGFKGGRAAQVTAGSMMAGAGTYIIVKT